MGAYGYPLILTKHAFFVLCMYRGHPNMGEYMTCMFGCPHMFGHPHMFGCPHVGHPLYVRTSPYVWMLSCLDAPYIFRHPGHPHICLDVPICVDTPICLDIPLCVWMTKHVFFVLCVWMPPYVWMPPICLDIPPVCLDDKACFLCFVCSTAGNTLLLQHLVLYPGGSWLSHTVVKPDSHLTHIFCQKIFV